MAARKHPTQHQRTKDKIRTSQLITRLQNNAFGKLKHPMTSDQIRCASILINKTLPDMKALELEITDPILIEVLRVSDHKAAK